MTQTDEEKQAAEEAKAQAAATERIAELEKALAAAEEKQAAADAKVADLEGQIAGIQATASTPLPRGGTVTVDHKGKVVS